MNEYQKFIAYSRYSRWLDKEQRRESWSEVVDRYLNFTEETLLEKKGFKLGKLKDELKVAIEELSVVPSMRAMMMAGPALDRCNLGAYNCSYLPVDSPRAFDETMYILMCGTGVGFSVERQYISLLPLVNEQLEDTSTTIIVEDSRSGWARAFRELISLLYSGRVPSWDLSKLRPAGAKLKTSGGRSSGPEPLNELFYFTVNMFKKASGRKLTSLECHDLMCKIGEIVVVGGVRRSALISLSNLSDDRMRDAKAGQWWVDNPQRSLANNSVCYTEKPDTAVFMREWLALYQSKSGERGIFNRVAATKQASKSGRRNTESFSYGCNPSLRKGTKVWTTEGVVNIEELQDKTFRVRNLNGELSEATCWLSGRDKPLYEITLQGGHKYYATKEHKWPKVNPGGITKVSSDMLKAGDFLPVIKTNKLTDGVLGSREDGFAVGWNLGDGWITEREKGAQIGFIVSEQEKYIRDKIQNYLVTKCDFTGNFLNKSELNVNNHKLRSLFSQFKVVHKREGLPSIVWKEASEEFRLGLLDGLFSSDGCVCANEQRIMLTSCHEKLVKDVSELLGFYGIRTTIKCFRREHYTVNNRAYDKPTIRYDLCIASSEAIQDFKNLISLSHIKKQTILNNYKIKREYRRNQIRVKSVRLSALSEDVWDISVKDQTHCFQLAHCITGNCSEIILRPYQLCNLSELVIRAEDDLDVLKNKVRLATILGTFQACFTDFKYLRSVWKKNTEEENLLGVSLTGIMDNKKLLEEKHSSLWLEELKNVAIETNKEFAKELGINQSVAITCVKPSGTVSQLVDSASGIHPRWARYYIRTVRGDNKDPITQLLRDQGVPCEPDQFNPNHTTVFSFPQKAPEGATTREELSSLDHLNIWKRFQDYWCEHKPSITVNVKEEEWLQVQSWVWDNFDAVSGIAFLPYDEHSYKQAPYQEIDKEQYESMMKVFPETIDWSKLPEYEKEDSTIGGQELACSSGVCEVVDLV